MSMISDIAVYHNTTLTWTLRSDILNAYQHLQYIVTCIVSRKPHSFTVNFLQCCLTELSKISTSLPVYFLPVVFLHIARRTSRNGLNDELMDILAVVVDSLLVHDVIPVDAAVWCY